MRPATATHLEHARQLLKRIEDDECAFRARVAWLTAEQLARALECFDRAHDKQRARIQHLESELAVSQMTE